ncbi:MAG: hypothetical protein SGPRY_003520 [Prymnesium sp.]
MDLVLLAKMQTATDSAKVLHKLRGWPARELHTVEQVLHIVLLRDKLLPPQVLLLAQARLVQGCHSLATTVASGSSWS